MLLLLCLKIFIMQTENGILNKDINRKTLRNLVWAIFVLFLEYLDLKEKYHSFCRDDQHLYVLLTTKS